jgi:hypothetical protein
VKVKLFEGFSHIDFTYANHHILVDEILKAIEKSFDDKNLKQFVPY